MGGGGGGRGAGVPVVLVEFGGGGLELEDEEVQVRGEDFVGTGEVGFQVLRGGAGLLAGVGGFGEHALVGGDLGAQVGEFGGGGDQVVRERGPGFGGGGEDALAFGGGKRVAPAEQVVLGEAGALFEVVVPEVVGVGGHGGGHDGGGTAHGFAQGLFVLGQAAGAGLFEGVCLDGGGGGLEVGIVFEPGGQGFPDRLVAIYGDRQREQAAQFVLGF